MTALKNYVVKRVKGFIFRWQTIPILLVVVALVCLAAFPFPMRILEGPLSLLLMLGVLAMIFRGVFPQSKNKR